MENHNIVFIWLRQSFSILGKIEVMKYIFTLAFSFMFSAVFAQQLDIQGHRGARGLVPENTIPAFIRAIEEGVTTLELDVVITKDKQVLVSHEPYLSADICSKPNGEPVAKGEAHDFNIYQMTYAEIAKYDCGIRGNSRFPEQEPMKVSKPLLKDVIDAAEQYLADNNLPKVQYNIELKSSEEGDGVSHPEVAEFSELVFDLLSDKLAADRYTIQCFDFRVLQYWHKTYSNVRLVALVENIKGVEKNIETLGFTPYAYSPYYKLLNKKSVATCHAMGMKVVPWTVNTLKEMKDLVELGVDGIITDYPNLAKGL